MAIAMREDVQKPDMLTENLSYLQRRHRCSTHGRLHVTHGTEHVGFRRIRRYSPSHHRVDGSHSVRHHFIGHLVDAGSRRTHLRHPGWEVGVGVRVGVGVGVRSRVGVGLGGCGQMGSVDRGQGGARQGLGDAGCQAGLVVGDPQLRGKGKSHTHPLGESPCQLVPSSSSCTQGKTSAMICFKEAFLCATSIYTCVHTQVINLFSPSCYG